MPLLTHRNRRDHVWCIGCTPNCFMANCHPCYKETPSMKIANRAKAAINPDQAATLAKHFQEPLAQTPYLPLLQLMAEVLDHVSKGGNAYLVVGTTKSQDACTVTLVLDGDRATAYAPDLEHLGDEVLTWLQSR